MDGQINLAGMTGPSIRGEKKIYTYNHPFCKKFVSRGGWHIEAQMEKG